MTDGVIEEDLLEHAVTKAGNIKVLFLNACKSVHTAVEVYNHTNVSYSIGWPHDVSNQLALTWAKLFFEALRMDENNVKGAVQVANDAVVKSYHADADQLPVVLNGRVGQVMEENQRLRDELNRRGIVRVPTWMVIANVVLVVLLLANLLLLTATH